MKNKARDVFYLAPENEISQKNSKKKHIPPLDKSDIDALESTLDDNITSSGVENELHSPYNLELPLEEREDNELVDSNELEGSEVLEPTSEESPLLFSRPRHLNKTKNFKNLGVESDLTSLAQLIANITESYSSVIFLASKNKENLRIAGAHTLSSDFLENAVIDFGCSLIGWVAESKAPISVCPFEHDASTLLYYKNSQPLKSFIAIPILNTKEELLGVIACDSTKSYSFSQKTEKLLVDLSRQAASIIELNEELHLRPLDESKADKDSLDNFIETLRNTQNEKQLLIKAANLPTEIVSKDALAIVTLSENGIGKGKYYSTGSEQMEHHLLETVCRHNKVLCSERVVHAQPTDDLKRRSFLSVPFSVLEKEAGSLNLLSKPHKVFKTPEVVKIEKIAQVISSKLEHLRLIEKNKSSRDFTNLLSWKQFNLLATHRINESKKSNKSLSLIKVSFEEQKEIEENFGIEGAEIIQAKTERLIEQLMLSKAIACRMYNNKIFILTDSSEVDGFIHRFCAQILKFSPESLNLEPLSLFKNNLGEVLLSGAKFLVTKTPKDGETLVELTRKCLSLES